MTNKLNKNEALENNIYERIKHREREIAGKNIGIRLYKYSLVISPILILFVLLNLYILLYATKHQNFSPTPSDFSVNQLVFMNSGLLIFGIFLFLTSLIGSKKSPRNKKKKDEWLWRNGRKLFILQFFTIFSAAIVVLYGFFIKGVISYAYLANISLFFIYIIMIFLIFIKPYIIVQKTTYIISYFLTSAIIFIPFVYLYETKNYYLFLIMLLFIIPMAGGLFFAIKEKSHITLIQSAAIKVIHPDILYKSLKIKYKTISDKISALGIINELEINNEYGIKQALAEELIKENSSKNNIYFGFLIAFLVFLIATLSQQFIVDYLYQPYIKSLMCNILSYVCK